MMNLLISLIAILILALLALGIAMSHSMIFILAVVLPYAAFAIFLCGVIYRLITWAKSPVPFRIPTTCGQGKSLPWIKTNPLENPAGSWGVIGRMAQEIFLFRSLFRNTHVEIIDGRPVYGSAKWLWFFGLMFHWSLLIIVVRHLRFFIEPIASWIGALSAVDGFFEIGIPTLYLSDVALLAGLTFLFLRRIIVPQVRYISLFTDYFALLLIAGVVSHGPSDEALLPRRSQRGENHWPGLGHLFTRCPQRNQRCFLHPPVLRLHLMAWFPFSKLMHVGGIFLSPTRNLANNNRSERHVNPWNAPVKVHTYEEYEDEFRDKMKAAGLPVEKE